jgi:hypothetical protein
MAHTSRGVGGGRMSNYIETYYFPGERKRIVRVRIKAILWTLAISALIFTGLGYDWHYQAVTERHKAEIAKLEEKIQHYRSHWTPIREREEPVRRKR